MLRGRVFTSLLLVTTFVACTNDKDENLERLLSTSKERQVGTAPDYFLTKNGNDRVALIFGFMDDLEFCTKVAQMYMQRYPESQYSCVPAK